MGKEEAEERHLVIKNQGPSGADGSTLLWIPYQIMVKFLTTNTVKMTFSTAYAVGRGSLVLGLNRDEGT